MAICLLIWIMQLDKIKVSAKDDELIFMKK
jgi:hypothetical protein